MEYLPNNITLELPAGTFPLSTDSVVLAHFVHLPKNARVLDLGSGCGTLGLMLCASDPGCTVTGVELTPENHTSIYDTLALDPGTPISSCSTDRKPPSPGRIWCACPG